MKNSFVFTRSQVKIVVAKTTTIEYTASKKWHNEHIATTKITKNASSKSTDIVLFVLFL